VGQLHTPAVEKRVLADKEGVGPLAHSRREGRIDLRAGAGTNDLAGKRVELLRQVVPALRQLAILANVSNPNALIEMGEIHTAARTLGVEGATFELRRAEDIAPAFEALKGHADALYVVSDPLSTSNRLRINTLALGARGIEARA
jgi:ABC-type uncharacterized transport system substrate-binding protein